MNNNEEFVVIEEKADTKTNRSVNKYVTYAIVGIVICALLVFGYFRGRNKVIDISSLIETEKIDHCFITIPSKWYIHESGYIFEEDGGFLKDRGTIGLMEVEENDFKETIEYYKSVMEVEELSVKDFMAYKLSNGEESVVFLFKDEVVTIIDLFENDNDTLMKIVDSIKY